MAATLSACSTRLQVQAQASGTNQPAYELRGSSLLALQAEAARLCPQGAEVLRQWSGYERAESEAGFVRRWSVDLIDTPRSQAQLQVRCILSG